MSESSHTHHPLHESPYPRAPDSERISILYERVSGLEKQILLAFSAAEAARSKAEDGLENRLDALNEMRSMLSDREATYAKTEALERLEKEVAHINSTRYQREQVDSKLEGIEALMRENARTSEAVHKGFSDAISVIRTDLIASTALAQGAKIEASEHRKAVQPWMLIVGVGLIALANGIILAVGDAFFR